MALELGAGRKKKQKSAGQHRIIQLDLFKPTKKKYPLFDFEEIKREKLGEVESSDDERFHDQDALELVRRLEAKYGGKVKKSKKNKKFSEDDFIDKTAGYELDDPFIDDSEAYDELIPSNWDTAEGGFYVNKGKLEFKEKYNPIELSDLSEDEAPSKAKKRKPQSDDEMEVEEEISAMKKTEENKKPRDSPTSVTTRPSMTGAPPTKKFTTPNASMHLKAKALVKKSLVGAPPSLIKNRIIKTNIGPKATATPSKSTENGVSNPRENTKENLESPPSHESMVGSSPHKKPRKPLPALSQTLSNMIEDFKKCTANLAPPGKPKKLQTHHIDMIINFDDQYAKDGLTVHERARVIHSIAEYVGIQRNSLYTRIKNRKEELRTAVMTQPGGENEEEPQKALDSPKKAMPTEEEIQVIEETPKTAGTAEKEFNVPTKDHPKILEIMQTMTELGMQPLATGLLKDYTTLENYEKICKMAMEEKIRMKQKADQKAINGQKKNEEIDKLKATIKEKCQLILKDLNPLSGKLVEDSRYLINQKKVPKCEAVISSYPQKLVLRIREMFKDIVALGIKVHSTLNAKNTVSTVDLVLSDIQLLGMDKLWAYAELCLINPNLSSGLMAMDSVKMLEKQENVTLKRLIQKMSPNIIAKGSAQPSDEDVQLLNEQGNIPSTSSVAPSKTVTPVKQPPPVSKPSVPTASASQSSLALLQNLQLAMTKGQNPIMMQQALQALGASDPAMLQALGSNPQMMQSVMQSLQVRAVQQAMQQMNSQREQEKKKLQEEKEKKQREKDEKARLIAQKKIEAAAEKQKQIEEKKKKAEEEKRKKAEEKAKKEEEERQKRLKEQMEREKRFQEERERLEREEMERKRREEQEQQRLAAIRKQQEERLVEEERVRRQEEQAAAARAALSSQMEQKPTVYVESEMKPMTQQEGQQHLNGYNQAQMSNFQQPSIPQSPQFGSPFTGPGSNGMLNQSPQQPVGQSPYQMNQSPMSHHVPQSPIAARPPAIQQHSMNFHQQANFKQDSPSSFPTSFSNNNFGQNVPPQAMPQNHQFMNQQQQHMQQMMQQRMYNQQLEQQQRLEHQRMEQQRMEQQRLEQQRLEQQRLEQQRLEQQRILEEQRRLQQMQQMQQMHQGWGGQNFGGGGNYM